jgi:hypothetical protein
LTFFQNRELESSLNPQAGKPALRNVGLLIVSMNIVVLEVEKLLTA